MRNSPDRHKRELVNICECWESETTIGRAAMTRAVMARALRHGDTANVDQNLNDHSGVDLEEVLQ